MKQIDAIMVRAGALVVLALMAASGPAEALQQVEFIQEVGDAGAKKGKVLFSAARAVAAHGDRFYIADTDGNRVVVLDQKGKQVSAWGVKGSKPGQLRSPEGIAVDDRNQVYLSDTGNHRIAIFDNDGKPVLTVGSKGPGPRELNSPQGLKIRADRMYIADTGNRRVLVLTTEGLALGQIGGPAQLKEPVDVDVDSRNRVYVLDAGTNLVQVYGPDGVLLAKVGAPAGDDKGLDRPSGIAVDRFGCIYVADRGAGKLKKYLPDGALAASAGSRGNGPGQFQEPAGMAIDRYNRAVVLDAAKNTLQLFTTERGALKPLVPASPLPSVALLRTLPGQATALVAAGGLWSLSNSLVSGPAGSVQRNFGIEGSKPGQLKKARGMAVDSAGNFWIADTGNDRVQKFAPDGSFLQMLGEGGGRDGQFDEPTGVAVSSQGRIFVADRGNRRVQIFSAKGVFQLAFGKSGKLPGQFSEPVDVAVDSGENIYVVDKGNARIAKYDGNGKLQWETGKQGAGPGEFSGPENIVVSPDGELYVLDAGNSRIQALSTDGKFLRLFGSEGTGPGMFREPLGLALQDGIMLFVSDRGNGRIQAFTLRQVPAVPAKLDIREMPNEIQVSWKANSESYVEGYRVYRADPGIEEYALLATVTDPFYNDRALPSNKTYRYAVSCKAREGHASAPSEPAEATTPKLAPSEPRNLIANAREKQVTLSWRPNTEPFMSHYRVYRKTKTTEFEKIAKTDQPVYVDKQLADDTEYRYRITAVGREDDESPPSKEAVAATPKPSLTAPPLDMVKVELSPLFASAYKYYESHPLGTVTLRNNTDREFAQVKLSFSVKNFMDFPTEQIVATIGPRTEATLTLSPVLNNRILEVTENTPLQSEIALTYFIDNEAKVLSRTFPLTLYERHAMTWDKKEKIGAFVTPRDPAVADFTRAIIQQYADAYPMLPGFLVSARALYDALGVMGLVYIVDPTSPFQEFSEKAAVVDYLQYPRDTLGRKSGDCDDLSVLYAAMLENIGINTALVDVPGHVFVLFNTGVSEKDKAGLGLSEKSVVAHRGTLWVPVEMTMVGASFTKAWNRGADEYFEWSAKGKAEIVEMQKAWDQFRPVTLPPDSAKITPVKRESIEARYPGEMEAVIQQRLENLSATYLAALTRDPNDKQALAQLGILYGEHGRYPEALEQFQKLLALDRENSAALCNAGNVYFLQERLDDARQSYEASLKTEPDDPGVLVNLARALQRSGKKDEAKKRFLDAMAIDPRVARRQADLARELGITK